MWARNWSVRLFLAGLFSVAAASEVGASDRSRLSPFELHNDGDMVVWVRLNGNGPFRFLFDTGSSRSVVSESIARVLTLAPLAETALVTPAGRTIRPVAVLRRLELGAAPPTNVLATIVPDAELGRSRGVSGIVGQDVLGALTYTIDYENRQIVWHVTMPRDCEGHRLALQRSGRGLLVTLPQPSGVGDLHFVPDTGANGWVLFAKGRRLPNAAPLGAAWLYAMSEERPAMSFLIGELSVGGMMFRNQRAVIIDGGAQGLPGDGLLPLHLFARVTFNPREHQLIVKGY